MLVEDLADENSTYDLYVPKYYRDITLLNMSYGCTKKIYMFTYCISESFSWVSMKMRGALKMRGVGVSDSK